MTSYGKDFSALYNKRWDFWGPCVWPLLRKAVQQAGLKLGPSLHWLDLCCGAGSLLEILDRHGVAAVGVDLSAHQLAHARRNAPAAKLVRADVRRYRPTGQFHVVTCLLDSLNYLTATRDTLGLLRRVRGCLRPSGFFVFDINTTVGLEHNWSDETSVLRQSGQVVLVETSFNATAAKARCRFTGFVHSGRLWRQWQDEHVQRGYTAEQMQRLLRAAGLTFKAFDAETFGKPRRDSGRLLYVCRRGE